MSYVISVVRPRLMRRYQAVHVTQDCEQARRARCLVEVPSEFVRYLSPCCKCVLERWWQEDDPPDALFDWYRSVRTR